MPEALSDTFFSRIPKTDIHLHLDGSLRLETLIELSRATGSKLPSYTEAGLRQTVFKAQYADLPDYLKGFAYILPVMQTPENLERIAYELAEDCIAENVCHIEVRYAPQQHVRRDFSFKEVVASVDRGLARAAKERNESAEVKAGTALPFSYGIILSAMRFFTPQMSECYADFFRIMSYATPREVFAATTLEMARAAAALADEGFPVVAIDLAGAENGYPALDHKAAFDCAQRHFIGRTLHAGEAFGAESIYQAITQCHAERIGHGTFLFDVSKITPGAVPDPAKYIDKLVDTIAKRRITLEVCPTSNLQTLPEIKSIQEHPVREMIARELAVSVSTDNRLFSTTTPAKELKLLADGLGLSRRQVRNLVLAGFKGAFYAKPYAEKRKWVRRVMGEYERVERELLPPAAEEE